MTSAFSKASCCDSCLAATSTIVREKIIATKLMVGFADRLAAAFSFALAIDSSSNGRHQGRSVIDATLRV